MSRNPNVPNDVLENKVSVCKNFVPIAGGEKPLFLLLTQISPKNRSLIERLRNGETEVKGQIQSYTPSGVYPDKRDASALTEENFSGVFQVDIDGKQNGGKWVWPMVRDAILKEFSWVVACGISCGGEGLFVLGKVDKMNECEQASKEAGKLIEDAIGVVADRAVKNRASLRFMTLPEETVINESPQSFEVTGEIREKPKGQPIPDVEGSENALPFDRIAKPGTWHYTNLSDYISVSINQGVKPIAVIEQLEGSWDRLFDKASAHGPKQDAERMVMKYYNKYPERFGIEKVENAMDALPETHKKKPIPERPTELVKVYIAPELQAELMELCALSPFVPMRVQWNDDFVSVCNSMILVGPPESGKNVIDRLIKPMKEFNHYIAEDRKWEEEEEGEEGKRKKKKQFNHLQPITGFESTDAAVQGSLGRFRGMVMSATEIDTAVSSMGKEYNSGRNALLRQLTEGESISKILKNTGDGVTKIEINEPKFSMILGGTPGSVDKFLGGNVENGFSSRAFVVELPPLNLREPRKVRVQDVTKLITFAEMAMYGDYKLEQCGNVRYDYAHCIDLCERLQIEFPGMHGIVRGVRNCVKLAAVRNWLRDRRSDFVIVKNEDIERYLPALILTLEYIEEVSQVKRDHFGRDITREVFAMKAQIREGKMFEIKPGVSLSADQVEDLREVYARNEGNIQATAKETGVSRNTVKKFCKTVVVKGGLQP